MTTLARGLLFLALGGLVACSGGKKVACPAFCSPTTCACSVESTRIENGDACEGDEACVSGYCAPNPYTDQICTAGFNCGHGGTCAQAPPDDPMQTSTSTTTTTTNPTTPNGPAANGQACQNGCDCQSGNCDHGTCAPAPSTN